MMSLEKKIPPPLVMLLFGALMWFVAGISPATNLSETAIAFVSVSLLAIGVVFLIAGTVAFKQAATTVNPLKPETASSLVTSGIYRITRNPMYVGLACQLLAWATYLDSLVAASCIFPYMLYMQRFQIQPEEKALTALFGRDFVDYTRQVRRWL